MITASNILDAVSNISIDNNNQYYSDTAENSIREAKQLFDSYLKSEGWKYINQAKMSNMDLSEVVLSSFSIESVGEVESMSMLDAYEAYPHLVRSYFNKINKDNTSNPWTYINNVFANNGLFIRVGKNSDASLKLINECLKDNSINNSYLMIIAEEGSNISIDHILDTNDSNVLRNENIEIVVLNNAHVNLNQINKSSSNKGIHFQNIFATVSRNGSFTSNNYTLGSDLSFYSTTVDLIEENTTCDLNGLYLLQDKMNSHHQIQVNHLAPHCNSNQLYKGILKDASVSEFSGSINVERNSQQIDAFQLNRNLLLSSKAKAHTRPQLQIDADDVKCSHGASIGQLDADQLIYFESRGISASMAKQILVKSFAEEIVEQCSSNDIKECLNILIDEYLSS